MKAMVKSAVILVALASAPALAADPVAWTLSPGDSKIAYGSIKKDRIGEVNHFTSFSGQVTEGGAVTVEIDVTSVETWIDIRNERMIKHVFDAASPTATLTARLDMAELNGLAVGGVTTLDVEGTLNLTGRETPIETSMFVARLGDDSVLVTTDELIMLPTEALGIDAGIDKLMELANLPSITRVAPVTLRLIFRANDRKS